MHLCLCGVSSFPRVAAPSPRSLLFMLLTLGDSLVLSVPVGQQTTGCSSCRILASVPFRRIRLHSAARHAVSVVSGPSSTIELHVRVLHANNCRHDCIEVDGWYTWYQAWRPDKEVLEDCGFYATCCVVAHAEKPMWSRVLSCDSTL